MFTNKYSNLNFYLLGLGLETYQRQIVQDKKDKYSIITVKNEKPEYAPQKKKQNNQLNFQNNLSGQSKKKQFDNESNIFENDNNNDSNNERTDEESNHEGVVYEKK